LKLWLLTVGKPGRLLLPAIEEYEKRAARYWSFEAIEVKEERTTKGASNEHVRDREAERLLKRIPDGSRVIALTRTGGDAFSSERFARHLSELAAHGANGVVFLIGGAFGLGKEALVRADRRLRLSTFTLSHDLARLVLAEQLYRAGTILRGEPYHKGVRDA
jgi:23S rRNA (pseudouridine1915-N3)-methyltransferase